MRHFRLLLRAGVVEALVRVAGVACGVAFASYFGDRWAFLAAAVGAFVLTTEYRL